MNQAITMNATDNQKNVKAAAITIVVHAALLFLFFIITIAMAVPAPPPKPEEGIEVNLGNSDIGFGDIEPMVPGDPAPEVAQEEAAPQQQNEQPVQETEKEVSERDDPEAPEINKPATVTKPTKVIPKENPLVTTPKPATTTVANPKPAPPQKPKAVYGGGTGTGGNNSDTYNNSRNQGIAGGTGNQGKPGGNPNSDNYNGNGGTGTSGGPRVTSGNRKIIKYYSFSGDLDKATIYAIIRVSPEGRGTFVRIGPRSTSYSQAYATAITEYLRNIQFDKSEQESTVTVQFNFKVND